MESKNLVEPCQERMQTYFDINHNNELQIVGKLVKGHSKAGMISLEDLGSGYISVCTKLGCTYVDSKCRPNEVPSWTLSQIDNQLLDRLQRNRRQKSFFVMKDGINFCFSRQEGLSGARDNILAEFFLDQVVMRVKILPLKYKTIKNPIHFYGELVKTKAGAEYLRQSKHLEKFRQDILSTDTPLVAKRAALWALGHIGANELGIRLIIDADLIQPIINLAENADFLSLRGTCIYIIGMLSNTNNGKHAIQKYDWIASRTKGINSVCLPRDPRTLFTINEYKFEGSITTDPAVNAAFKCLNSQIPLNDEEKDIIKNICNLLNSVYEVQAISELRKKSETKPELFQNPKVFEHVLLLLEVYRFRPKGRKFIFNLFEGLLFNDGII
jgi:rapamycin-insensitive companion of mTOR